VLDRPAEARRKRESASVDSPRSGFAAVPIATSPGRSLSRPSPSFSPQLDSDDFAIQTHPASMSLKPKPVLFVESARKSSEPSDSSKAAEAAFGPPVTQAMSPSVVSSGGLEQGKKPSNSLASSKRLGKPSHDSSAHGANASSVDPNMLKATQNMTTQGQQDENAQEPSEPVAAGTKGTRAPSKQHDLDIPRVAAEATAPL